MNPNDIYQAELQWLMTVAAILMTGIWLVAGAMWLWVRLEGKATGLRLEALRTLPEPIIRPGRFPGSSRAQATSRVQQ